MLGSKRILLLAIPGLAAIVLASTASSSLAATTNAQTAPGRAPAAVGAAAPHRRAGGSQDLYLGNILGGVLLYSTGRNPQEVGDITDQLPRVTGVWVDQSGVLYAFTDNRQYPYETIEEFQPGATSPFFSLVLQHYGLIAVADAKQNVYAQGQNGQQSVIDVYPPGSQNYLNEYVVPSLGQVSGVQGMAFDSNGALLVGVAALTGNKFGQIGGVFRLDTASGTFTNLNLQKAIGGLIATDGAGNLYVGGGNLIQVYAPGATTPSRTVRTKTTITTLTVAVDGTLYVQTYQRGIIVYAPGKDRPRNTFLTQAQVSGMALGPG